MATLGVDVSNTDGSTSTIGTSGSKTNSNTSITNTINNLVKQLQQSATSTKSNTDSSSAGTTDQSNTGTSTSTSTGTTASTGTSTTASDAGSIALSKGVAAQALSNSEDATKTTGLVDNIIKQAAIAFAPTRVATNNSGSYNSTSTEMLADNARALATGQAAGAVLNYQTAQQQIANSAAGDLLNATKTTSNSGESTTAGTTVGGSTSDTTGSNTQNTSGSTNTVSDTNQSTNTDTSARINTITKLLQNIFSNNQSSTDSSSTTEKAGVSITIICTTLAIQEKLDKKSWVAQMRRFQNYPEYGKQGYYIWARPCVRELQRHPESVKSSLITKLFLARARGFIPARCLVTFTSFLLGLYWLVFLKKEFTKEAQLALFSE